MATNEKNNGTNLAANYNIPVGSCSAKTNFLRAAKKLPHLSLGSHALTSAHMGLATEIQTQSSVHQ